MSRNLRSLCAAAAFGLVVPVHAALADAPRVAVDISPVHALVARVMDGVGEPDLVVTPGASPHGYQMRPSQARAVQDADLVVWIGEALTPWMAGAVDTLGRDARVLGLLEAEETETFAFRDGAVFGASEDGAKHEAHDHGHEGHAEKLHDGHDEDAHDHEDTHDKQAHEAHGHGDHGHDHDGVDPHAWLSPANAVIWMGLFADILAEIDPDNAEAYRANARAGQAEIKALSAGLEAQLAPLRGARFIVFHDAYQYFETSFGLSPVGAIALSDASDPSPARIAELRNHIAEDGIACVLAEPQFNPGLVAAVAEGSGARTGVLDPLGADLTPGPALYGNLLQRLANELATCLASS